jgi:hypothetical protein
MEAFLITASLVDYKIETKIYQRIHSINLARIHTMITMALSGSLKLMSPAPHAFLKSRRWAGSLQLRGHKISSNTFQKEKLTAYMSTKSSGTAITYLEKVLLVTGGLEEKQFWHRRTLYHGGNITCCSQAVIVRLALFRYKLVPIQCSQRLQTPPSSCGYKPSTSLVAHPLWVRIAPEIREINNTQVHTVWIRFITHFKILSALYESIHFRA